MSVGRKLHPKLRCFEADAAFPLVRAYRCRLLWVDLLQLKSLTGRMYKYMS